MATTELIELAIETSKHAYVPYSHVRYSQCRVKNPACY